MTIDQLERRCDELDEGELITMPPVSEEHGDVTFTIARLIGNHAIEHSLGRLYVGETGFKLSGDTVRAPDVSFMRKERAGRRKTFFPGAPDLAVEVVSPSDSTPHLMRKRPRCCPASPSAWPSCLSKIGAWARRL